MNVDILIIGAGMAGMTAAIYAKRAGKSVLVLEQKVAGGQIVTSDRIKNYPGFIEIDGGELMKNVRKQVEGLGVEIRYEEVLGVEDGGDFKKVWTDEGKYNAKAVILAMGRAEDKLGVPGGDLAGVSYCATCDGALYAGKNVAVIGGGNTALYEALYLSEIVKKVYVIHRREQFRGDAKLVQELEKKANVEFVMGVQTRAIIGDDKVAGVKVEKRSVSEKAGIIKSEVHGGVTSENGLPDAKAEGEEIREIAVEGVFVAVGQKPQTGIVKDLVELDNKGYVVAGEDCHTSVAGVYVAGDCRTKKMRQLVTAAADGAMAASEAAQEM